MKRHFQSAIQNLLFGLFLLAPLFVFGQIPNVGLLANINPTAATGSSPSGMTKLGSIILFSASDGTNGTELWKSDGTLAGTVLVKDIRPGSSSSSPSNFVVMGSFVYFTANDGTVGGALWRTDGSTAGTTLVKDVNTASTTSSSFIGELTAIGSKLYFRGWDSTNGEEPWVSDGTPAGTNILKIIRPGTGSSSAVNTGLEITNCFGTFEFVEFNGFVYFNANDGANSGQNSELWRTDGTGAGTVLFKDFYSFGGGGPGNLVNAGSFLFFTADNSFTGVEPWKTDGTAGGTVLIKDVFNPGFNQGSILGDVPTIYMNGYVYFVAVDVNDPSNFNLVPPQSGYINAELWRTDGTSANTTKVKEINPGMSGLTSDANPSNFYVFNNKLYFSATDGTNGTEPWVTDGTSANTFMLKNIDPAGNSSPSNFTEFGGFVYFRGDDNATNGAELWRTDGTTIGTVLVKDINPGTVNGNPGNLEVLDANHMLLSGTNAIVGSELYILGGYKIAVTTGANGITTLPGAGSASTTIDVGVKSGSSSTFTFTPDATYNVQTVTADAASAGALSSYTFSNVTANHTLSVTFGIGVPTCASPPTAPTSALSDVNNFCSNAGGNISLSAVGGSGTTLQWYSGSCGGTPVGTGTPLSIAKPTTTTTYFARWESPNCTSSGCASVVVTVINAPVAPTSALSDVNNFCSNAGGSLTLSATGGSGGILRWYNGSCSSFQIGTGSPLTFGKPTSTTTYYARWESPGCTPSTCASVTVTVNTLPTAPTSAASDANNFCSNTGGTLNLSATGGSGGTLTWYSGACGSGGAIGTGSPLNIAKPTSTTTYYARWESTGCTPSTCASVTVTVNALPTAPASAMSDANNFCSNAGGNLNLSASGGSGGTLTWYSGACGSGGSIGTGTPLNIAKPTGTTTYYARWESTGCTPSACASTTVTVNPLPNAGTISGATTICAGGGTTQLSSDGAGGGTWSSDNTAAATVNSGSGLVSGVAGGTASITYTVTASGCNSSTNVLVTVNALPNATITPTPNPVCQNSTLNLSVPSAGAGASYNWSGSGVVNANSNATTAVPTATGSQPYAVTVTAANTCSATSSTSVTVNAQPSATITPSPNPVCQNSTLNLSVPSAGAGASYNWSGSGVVNANSNATTAVPTATGSQPYAVTVTAANTCSATSSTSVTVNAQPSATITPNPNPVCQNSTLNLSVPSAGAGASYNWSGSGVVNANSNATTAVPTATGSQPYAVTVTAANTCSATSSTSVTVNAQPSATITPSPNPVCQNSTLNLSVPNAGGGASYNWSGSGIANNNANATTAVPTATGPQPYAVTVTNANGCSATNSTNVTVNAQPSATITPNPSPVCQNSTLNLSVPNAGVGASYNWSGNGINNANANATTAVPTIAIAQAYAVTVTSANTCSNTGSVNVTVNPLPSATITATQSSGCGPALVNLSVLNAGGGASYNWSGNGVVNANSNATTANPNSGGNQTYQVTVTNAQGCSQTGSTSILINICINGRIIWKTDNTSGVKDVTVALTGDQSASVLTPLNGTYSFNFNSGSSFMIAPSKNLNKLNGVNAQDVFRIQQHLSGGLITDPYQLVAADVNSNNTITALDANIIQLSLTGNPQALAQFVNSWRFVPTAHVMTNPPWGFPEKITIANSGSGLSNQDFYGIKVGDVVALNANPANLAPEPPFVLTATDKALQAGDEVEVNFQASQTEALTAMQFGLHFDPQRLELTAIESQSALPLSEDNFGLYEKDLGRINFLWAGTESMNVPESAPVFRLKFKVLASGGQLSEALQLSDETLPALAFKVNNAEAEVLLHYFGTTGVSGTNPPRLQLLQNQPNPFTSRTLIGFELPEACAAQLRIMDASGRVIAVRTKQYPAGLHSEVFELEGVSGVLYYELTTPFGVLTKKMVTGK